MQSKARNQKRKNKTIKIEGIIKIPNSFDRGKVFENVPVFDHTKSIGVIRHCGGGKIAAVVAQATMEVMSATVINVDYTLPKRVFDKLDIAKLGFGLSGIVSEREDNVIEKFELSGVSLIKK